jgi:LEA14-like dessication related protein
MRHVLLVSLLAVSSGCALLREILREAFIAPAITAVRSEVVGADFEALRLRAIATVENRNPAALEVSSVVYWVDVKGERVAEGDLPGGMRLPARGTAEMVVPAEVPWKGGSELLRTLVLGDGEPIPYRIAARLGVETPVGRVLLPLEQDGSFTPPRRPKVTFVAAGGRVSSAGSEVLLDLDVENPNPFPIPSWGLDLRATLAGRTALEVPPVVGEPLGAGAKKRVQARARLSVVSAAAGFLGVLSGEGTVELKGALKLGGIDVPFDGAVPLGR